MSYYTRFSAAVNLDAHILVEDRDGKKVIVFEVRLNLDEIIELQQQSLSQSYDAYPEKQRISELQLGFIDQFVRRVNDRGRYNLPRAKVFMGDVGSIFLGFVFASFVIKLSAVRNLSDFVFRKSSITKGDIKKVYHVLHNQLDDFRKFAQYVDAYLTLHGTE